MIRASALQSVHLGFILQSRVIPNNLKNSIQCFSVGAQHKKESVENKPESLLVLLLGKALNGMPPSLWGKQVVGSSSLPVVVTQSDKRHANKAGAPRHE